MTLIFGTGAVITPTPVTLPAGETFLRAQKALKPAVDAMRVGIELGKSTEEKKTWILNRQFHLQNIGKVQVSVCKSETECLPMTHTGPYYSNDAYGIGFEADGASFKKATFVGVKIRVDAVLKDVVIGWSNYSQ